MEDLLLCCAISNKIEIHFACQTIMASLLCLTQACLCYVNPNLPFSWEYEPNGEGRESTVTPSALYNSTREFIFLMTVRCKSLHILRTK